MTKLAKKKTKRQSTQLTLILTKPNTSTPKKKQKLVVAGLEDKATLYRSRQIKIDALEAEQKRAKAELIKVASRKRRAAEVAGNFHKTCAISVEDGKPVLVVYQDKYTNVNTVHEKALRAALNSHYNSLITRRFDLKIKPDTTLSQLRAALGNKFDAFVALVDVNEHLTISGNFMEKRAMRRDAMSDEENDAVDTIADQIQYQPQVKSK